jgi:hypothetical protein
MLSTCVVILSLLSVFDVLFIPGLLPFMVTLTMGGLLLINYPSYKKGYFKKPFWISFAIVSCIAVVGNLALSVVQLIKYFA